MKKLFRIAKIDWEHIILLVFFIVIALIKFPPFYFLIIPSKLLTSHIVAKIIILGIALFITYKKKARIFDKNNQTLIIITLFFFFSQSISILKALDPILFLKEYQNIFFNLILFYIALFLLGKQGSHILFYRFILYFGIFIIIVDCLFLIFPYIFIEYLKPFLQDEFITLYVYNLFRYRYNLYLNTELFFSFYALQIFKDKKITKENIFYAFLLSLIVTLAILSNFRHRLLFIIVSLFIIVIPKVSQVYKNKKIIFGILIIVLTLNGIYFSTQLSPSRNIIGRLLLENESEDSNSIISRLNHFYTSIDLLKCSPLTGIGLGNYQLYVEKNYNLLISSKFDKLTSSFFNDSIKDPHSIISKLIGETGIVGILSYIIMIAYFVKNDFQYWRNKPSIINLALIASYWSFFVLSLITPSTSLFRGGWMWIIRGAIEGNRIYSDGVTSSVASGVV